MFTLDTTPSSHAICLCFLMKLHSLPKRKYTLFLTEYFLLVETVSHLPPQKIEKTASFVKVLFHYMMGPVSYCSPCLIKTKKTKFMCRASVNIVTCQAQPALVKKANQMCGSFLFWWSRGVWPALPGLTIGPWWIPGRLSVTLVYVWHSKILWSLG